MKSSTLARMVAASFAIIALPGTAFAQSWAPGSEVIGQPIQVTTNGVANTVYLDAGGTARILTPGGNTLPGTWTAASGQLCLSNGSAQECWPYNAAMQAGQPMTMTSSCGATSTWLASATNSAMPAPRGERGK